MNTRLITILAAFAALMLSGSQVFAHNADVSARAAQATHVGGTVATVTEDPDQATTDEDTDNDEDEDEQD